MAGCESGKAARREETATKDDDDDDDDDDAVDTGVMAVIRC